MMTYSVGDRIEFLTGGEWIPGVVTKVTNVQVVIRLDAYPQFTRKTALDRIRPEGPTK